MFLWKRRVFRPEGWKPRFGGVVWQVPHKKQAHLDPLPLKKKAPWEGKTKKTKPNPKESTPNRKYTLYKTIYTFLKSHLHTFDICFVNGNRDCESKRLQIYLHQVWLTCESEFWTKNNCCRVCIFWKASRKLERFAAFIQHLFCGTSLFLHFYCCNYSNSSWKGISYWWLRNVMVIKDCYMPLMWLCISGVFLLFKVLVFWMTIVP